MTMEEILQETGKGFTIFYDMFHSFDTIVQTGVEFTSNHPWDSLVTLDPT